MNIVIRKNYEELSQKAVGYVLREMKEKPDCTLGLATGNTPLRLYSLLGEMHEKDNIDFSSIYTANIEEYWGVSRESEKAFYHYMEKIFFPGSNFQQIISFFLIIWEWIWKGHVRLMMM